jgi:hypothetical protein
MTHGQGNLYFFSTSTFSKQLYFCFQPSPYFIEAIQFDQNVRPTVMLAANALDAQS